MKSWMILALIALPAIGLSAIANVASADDVDYVRDIKPLFVEKCNACHGALQKKAGLRLDAGSLILKGSDDQQVVNPGNASDSILIDRVSSADHDDRMPPASALGEPLTAEQISTLKKWIDQGARIPKNETIPGDPREHWAYLPPRKADLPSEFDANSINPIDYFVQQVQRPLGIEPVAKADPHTLLRRVYFDLIGLPPTLEQLEAFANDPSVDHWETTVDQLLTSEHFGERWGRHWMDVWRYSDWDGYKNELRGSQRHIWRWRDWIVKSLNADKPYDQMIVEMLAADELAPGDTQSLAATGFLARNYHNSNRNIWLDATVEHTAKAFLGMTLNCARCHDHKFDPISQETYYQFRAIFEPHQVRVDRIAGQPDTNLDGLPHAFDADLAVSTFIFENGNEKRPIKEKPISPGVPVFLGGDFQIQPIDLPIESWFPSIREFEVRENREQLVQRLNSAEQKLSAVETGGKSSDELAKLNYEVAKQELAAFEARLAADSASVEPPAEASTPNALAETAATADRKLKLLQAEMALANNRHELETIKIDPKLDEAKKKKAIEQASNKITAAEKNVETAREEAKKKDNKYAPIGKRYPETSSGRRLALARWIASKNNPLTARVAINQIWMRHFGSPLVENVFDFGLRSTKPRHAELLDWLAVELMENDWNMKHIHRLIVMSKTWQQASSISSIASQRYRELDPDNHLYWRMNARRLDAEIIRDNLLAVSGQLDPTTGGPEIDFLLGESSRRRSIYLRHAYEKQMKMLMLFDAANPNECYRRSESVIPQQALALANSPLCRNQSRILAKKIQDESEKDSVDSKSNFIRVAFLRTLGRHPNQAELQTCVEFLDQQTRLLSATDSLSQYQSGQAATVKPADAPDSRARENLVHVLMNHHEFVTVR